MFILLIISVQTIAATDNYSGLKLEVSTNKSLYIMGEIIRIYGSLTYNEWPVSEKFVTMVAYDANSDLVLAWSTKTNSHGNYNITFRLSSEAKPGIFTVQVTSICGGIRVTNKTTFNLVQIEKMIVAWNDTDYIINLESNVTVPQVVVGRNTLYFNYTVPKGKLGYLHLGMPEKLKTAEIRIFINNFQLLPPPFPEITKNDTYYWIYAELSTGTYTVVVQFWLLGDITGSTGEPDLIVDMRDVGLVARSFASYPGLRHWNAICDITGVQYLFPDNKIDSLDLEIVNRHFGEKYT
jgi:hypothetical protein